MPSHARINGTPTQLDHVARDGHALIGQGLAAMVRVAQGKDAKHAVAAASFLVEYGERLLLQRASRQPEPVKAFQQSRAEILEELKGLYAKALPAPAPLVEAEGSEVPETAAERF